MLKHVRRDQGAVAPLIALCLVVLLFAVALAVDVGGLMLRRREMVNGADAAALAAAQSCADASRGSPEGQALTYAAKNVPASDSGLTGGILTGVDPASHEPWSTCTTPGAAGTGHVTVRYSSNQSLYFAPVLGFHRTSLVTTQATASWGPAGGAAPIPLVFSNIGPGDPNNTCKIPQEDFKGKTCVIWYANPSATAPSFGFINLGLVEQAGQWAPSVDQLPHCNTSWDINPQLYGSGVLDLASLNYPDPSWACAYPGDSLWNQTYQGQKFDQYVNATQPERDFPIVGDTTYQGQSIYAFDVIGFTHLKLLHIFSGQDATGLEHCVVAPDPTRPGNYSLVNLCGQSYPASAITDLSVSGSFTTAPCGQQDKTCFDPSTGVLTLFSKPNSTQAHVEFDIAGTGQCGPLPPGVNPGDDVHCIVVQWLGAHFGGTAAGNGADFGVFAANLCDLSYGSCADQRSP